MTNSHKLPNRKLRWGCGLLVALGLVLGSAYWMAKVRGDERAPPRGALSPAGSSAAVAASAQKPSGAVGFGGAVAQGPAATVVASAPQAAIAPQPTVVVAAAQPIWSQRMNPGADSVKVQVVQADGERVELRYAMPALTVHRVSDAELRKMVAAHVGAEVGTEGETGALVPGGQAALIEQRVETRLREWQQLMGDRIPVRVSLGCAAVSGGAGKPVLPVVPSSIMLPANRDLAGVEVALGNKVTLDGKYFVLPGEKPVPLIEGAKVEYAPPDPAVYESDAVYPPNRHNTLGDNVQQRRGVSFLISTLHPVEYAPKSGRLSYYETVNLKVATQPAAGQPEIRYRPDPVRPLTDGVDNPETISTYGAAVGSGEPAPLGSLPAGWYSYVIVTSEALKNAPSNPTNGVYNFQDFLAWKASMGVTGTIMTVEQIYTDYSGVDSQDQIRNFIKDAFNNWRTDYVLLAGDADGKVLGGETEAPVVPVRILDCLDFYVDGNIASDLYYQCLDGTFDYNNDGLYGRAGDGSDGGEVDVLAEVYVGRAPVSTAAQVSTFVEKTMRYAGLRYDDSATRALLVGEYLGFGGPSQYATGTMEELRTGGLINGIDCAGYAAADYFTVDSLYDSPTYTWSRTNIMALINSDQYNMIDHLGHCSPYIMMKMRAKNDIKPGNDVWDGNDVVLLTNEKPVFIYSQGCFPGSFDNWMYNVEAYRMYDSIAEKLLLGDRHGMVAGVLNSRYGFGMGNSTDGPSQWYHREFHDAFFGSLITRLGAINAASHEANAWRLVPGPYEDRTGLAALARWCLYESNLFGDPQLALNGVASAGPGENGTMKYVGVAVADAIGAQNGDGWINPGEFADLTVTVRHTGMVGVLDVNGWLSTTDAFVTVTDATAAFGDVRGRWASKTALDPFRIQVANNCPTPYLASFTMVTADSGGQSWTNTFAVTIYTSSRIAGHVTDLEGGAPITGATVAFAGTYSGAVTTRVDGAYGFVAVDGTYAVVAKQPGVYLDSPPQSVSVPPSATNIDFLLGRPIIGVAPTSLVTAVVLDQVVTQTLTVANTGSLDLNWSFGALLPEVARSWAMPAVVGLPIGGIAGDGKVLWVARYGPRLYALDPVDGHLLRTLDVVNRKIATVAWDGTRLWGVDYTAGMAAEDLVVVDPKTGAILKRFAVPFDQHVSALAAGGGSLWAFVPWYQMIVQLDPDTGAMLGTLPCPSVFWNLGMAYAHGTLWTIDERQNLYQVNPADGTVLRTMKSPAGIDQLSGDDSGMLWGSSSKNGNAYQIDLLAWLQMAPTSGVVTAKHAMDVSVVLDTSKVAGCGTYRAMFHLLSNDPQAPDVAVPVICNVIEGPNAPPAIDMFSPATPCVATEGVPQRFSVSATDADGQWLRYTWALDGQELTNGTDSSWLYLPEWNAAGAHLLQVTVADRHGGSAAQSWNVTVTHANGPPKSSDVLAATTRDTPAMVGLAAIDPDGDTVSYTIVSTPANGTLSGHAPLLIYTPRTGFTGYDSFLYCAADGTTTGNTARVTLSVIPPTAASFVRMDTTTQGSWKGKYGCDGYNVFTEISSTPIYASCTPKAYQNLVWARASLDKRALQKPSDLEYYRVAACYESWDWYIHLSLQDNRPHRVAFYCLDWYNEGFFTTISIYDRATSKLLARQAVSAYNNGKYVVFDITGSVEIWLDKPVVGLGGHCSGIFFGEVSTNNHAPELTLWPAATPNPASAGEAVWLTAAATDADGDPLSYAWNFGDGTTNAPQATATASHVYANPGSYTGRVTVSDGQASVSALAPITVRPVGTRTLTVNTTGAGTVTLDPPGGAYASGTTVTLTELPDAGCAFGGWSGQAAGTNLSVSVLMDADKTVAAAFTGTPVAAATWAGVDTTTRGTWKGTYGTDGYIVIGNATNVPAYARVSALGNSEVVLDATTTDMNAPQKANPATDRILACWTAPSTFTIDLNLVDGNTHRVAFYCMEPTLSDYSAPGARIEILNAANGVVLSTRDAYTYGTYQVWDIRGHVLIRFTNLTHPQVAVNAIFFGAPLPAYVTISASTTPAASAGSITPTGAVQVARGGNQTFTITPYPGYYTTVIYLDNTGCSPGDINVFSNFTYTFTNVTINHSIRPCFSPAYYITATSGAGGSLAPSGVIIAQATASKTFTITPNAGATIVDVKVDGLSVGAVTSYTFANVATNHSITASFLAENQPPSLTASASHNWGLVPLTVQFAAAGADPEGDPVSYGWNFGDGVTTHVQNPAHTFLTNGNFTVKAVASDGHGSATTVSVAVAVGNLTIQSSASPGGTIVPSGVLSVPWLGSRSFTMTPYAGYRLARACVDGAPVGKTPSYTLSGVTANHALTADFAPPPVIGALDRAGIGEFTLRWPGFAGEFYRITGSTNLMGDFTEIVANHIPGVAPMNCHTVTVDSASPRFYRMEVEP